MMTKRQPKNFWELNSQTQMLEALRESGNLRELHTTASRGAMIDHQGKRYINLSSNDYLGLSASSLQEQFFAQLNFGDFILSNPSSRLMTGNSVHYERLEQTLAALYGDEDALVVGSGFLLNSGILPAVTSDKDVIIADKLMHASLIDGMRLSSASYERFAHNDMNHLERLLQKRASQRVIVATESLFSMDGDRAPLDQIAELQSRYDFELYLDEAHAFGVHGTGGLGYATLCPGLRVDYRVATFGKAICSQGAFVGCSATTKAMLINKMRTLIFSTALPPISLLWTQFVIERLNSFDSLRQNLADLVAIMGGQSQIIPLIVGDNLLALNKVSQLREAGYWATAIRHPTVPEGTARLRFSLTAAHNKKQIEDLCKLLG